MSQRKQSIETLKQLRRARDLMDREYASALTVANVAASAYMSPAHFSREFKAAYGETPYAYLMARRVERAMALLRNGETVTEACIAVGATSLGSFSTMFARVTGQTPSEYRAERHAEVEASPACMAKILTRPTRQGALIKD